ncbi:MAG: dockerin type I repeat-containing protein [Vescimonas sp.]|uniref:dockerin type I repeat-containing protein n=1 Tax=Vescimonas sp. TaxID=2892404 RepID=UPI002A91AB32|nr:dockerin type I repeat-containing protein [Vescimonas sp.]MDY5334315.1 dockerin type I repeat-containing protein [Vescimonas sp.]
MVIEGYGTLTIAPGATLALEEYIRGENDSPWTGAPGGKLECSAPLVIQGTLDVGKETYLNLQSTVTVENGGKLIVQENGEYYSWNGSFTVKAGGHVTNNGWMSFGEDSAITVEGDWAVAWTQGEGAEANKNVAARLEQGDNADQKIEKALTDINASTLPDFFSYTLSVYRQDDGERIELTQDLTIPAGVELAFSSEGATTYIAEGAALTIQGGLYSDAPFNVDGKLTVSANGWATVWNNLLVGGTLTIDEGGRMYCQYLTDENEQGKAGTIVNNGSLAAEQFDLKHNEVDIGGGDDGSKVVRSLEALKSALAEGGQINYRGTELTISEDLTIPENVNLTINVTTFTVNEGVTLTNKGNVWLHGDAYLYGKLDVSNESGYFGGYGVVKAGGEDNLVGDEYGNRQFNWTARISKEGTSETLTQEELTAAGASTLANRIEIDLGSQTTLTLADGLEIRDKNVYIWGANAAKVVVNGTLSVWNYLNLDAPMTVNGTVNVYDSVYASRDITVSTGGKLHVRNYLDKDTYRQWTGSVEFENNAWIALPEGAAWDNYVTVDDGCRLGVNRTVNADNLESFLQSCNDGRDYIVTLHMNRHEGESMPLYIATGTTLTIPENVELTIYDLTGNGYDTIIIGAADESGNKGEVVVDGLLRIYMPTQVDGTLTINGEMWAFSGDTTTVNGAMTVNEGGTVQFSRLAGTGTITNNGTLTANEKAVGTVIGGSGNTTIDNTRLEASNMAELKAALSSLSGSTERQTIFLCRSAMDDAAPGFVIDEDITVPSSVELRMDEMRSSNFRGLTVAENAKLTVAGAVYSWAEDGVTVNGTLETLYGGQDENGNWIPDGRIAAYSVTVASTGNLVNGGSTNVYDRDEQTGGTLAVEGKMENSGNLNCRDLQYSGTTLTNKGDIRVRQQLKIAEGSVIENTGWITYGDCDALDKINNSENATIRWEKTVNTVEELRTLLTRTENGTATLELREDCTLNEDLVIPGHIQLQISGENGTPHTLTVPENVTLFVGGQLTAQNSATIVVNGTLVTSGFAQVYGALTINESGVWEQKDNADVSDDRASVTIDGLLEQSESRVQLSSWRNGKIIFGANARWNEVGTISSYKSSTTITGFDPGRYKLSTSDGINYYLERVSSGGGSGGGETSTIGDVNGDGVVDQADLVALARFMAGIDDLEDISRADINGDGIYSAADLTALARMLEAQQGTQTADADENGAPVDTGAELNADAQDTVQTEDGGAPVEPAPVVDDVPETVEESVTGEVPQTEAGEQAA